jgi:AcrR family transcriptional regulator
VSYRNEDSVPRRAGRPRDPQREAEILRAVLDLVTEKGVEGVSFEEVARRARASKPTLYRRWSTRSEMIVAAIKAGPAAGGPADPVDTGSLRDDLLVLLDRLDATLAEGAPAGLALLHAGLQDPELCERIEEGVGPTGARLPDAVRRAAVERGELPSSADPFAYEEVAGATLLLRRLNGLDTDRAHREALVDAVLLPALRAGVPAGRHGIFSGRPSRAATAPTTSTGAP